MGVPQAEYHSTFTLQFGAITNAYDFQFTDPALGHSFDCIVDQGAGQTMNSSLRIVFTHGKQLAVLLFHADARGQTRVQFAFGTLHSDGVALNFDRDSLGERNRLFSNS